MDAKRVRDILEGTDTPETTGEELCLFAFENGKTGVLLREVVVAVDEEFNKANLYEMEMLLVGYMMGQSIYHALQTAASTTTH